MAAVRRSAPFALAAAALAGAGLLSACAGSPKAGPGGPGAAAHGGGAPTAERLVKRARALQEEKSCAAAAPTYRMAASTGAGRESAQHELGECLLTMAVGSSEAGRAVEARLFHEEGLFWLRRAAYAGNARAQRALAVHFGTTSNPDADAATALRWAKLYQANPDASVLGYKSLPATFVPGLESDVDAGTVADVASFVATFEPVTMATFEFPRAENNGSRGRGQRAQRPPQGGGQRRRR
ncbi:MAG: hypothetical protein AAGC56_11840 [Pseudomonadota bacterium]